MLGVQRGQTGPVTVLRLEGVIDEGTAGDLTEALHDCIREGNHHVVLNLSGVEMMNTFGVGTLLERLRQFRAKNGDMKLVGLNLYIQRLFRTACVTAYFDMYASEDEAIQVYRKAA